MSWAAIIVAGGTLAGGMISGNAAKKSQQAANTTNQRLADQKNAFDWNNYLLQRGYNANGTAKPGEIPSTAAAVNTSLALWASVNGQPAEQALFNRLLEMSGVIPAGASAGPGSGPDPLQSEQALTAFFESEPAFASEYARLTATGAERRTPTQWLRDHLQASPETMQQFYAFSQPAAGATETASSSIQQLIDPAYTDLQGKAIEAANQLFDGRYLQQQQAALAPILQARNTAADEIYSAGERSAGGIYDASLSGADQLYDATGRGVRSVYDADRLSADDIYNANLGAGDDLFGVRDRAARSIYDADLLSADTYQQSALEALNRLLGQNAATRGRQGFTGTTSGDALTRARLMADYTQQGAGVRAGAGQSLAQRLAEAAITQAMNRGTAGVSRATSRGVAGQSLAQRLAEAGITLAGNRGAAGLVRAGSRGTYDIGRATTRGQAGEQDAISRLALLTDDITRRLAGLNLPSTLAGNELSIRQAGVAGKYSDLDALLSRLSMFRSPASPSSLATPNISPTVNSGQIAGSAISNLAQSYGEYKNSQDILAAIKGMSGGTYKGIPVVNTPATATSYWD